MAVEGSHCCGVGKRRGDNLPARLRFVARRGVTLIELLIAMLVLAIACVAWLRIIGIQSARKEARRREAVERLAGMMDAFMAQSSDGRIAIGTGGSSKKIVDQMNHNKSYYKVERNSTGLVFDFSTSTQAELFDSARIELEPELDLSPIRYQLYVTPKGSLEDEAELGNGWGDKIWLVGKLYDLKDMQNGVLMSTDHPFFTLKVRLWY